ncbi:MAG: tRNA pseudouridine(55) synthase TruB [bacterium JZ-2024 1]
MNGFLPLFKPPGMTSFDAIRFLKKWYPNWTFGHTGVLDKPGCGVLVIACGYATRLVEYYLKDKKYVIEITLGITTDTHDATGKILSNRLSDTPIFSPEQLETVLQKFRGTLMQIPPQFSAKKTRGVKAYQLARKGVEFSLSPQEVTIYDLSLIHLTESKPQRVKLEIHCTTGTYMRALARDIGKELGCGAYLSFLVRTFAFPFSLEECLTLEEISESGNIRNYLRPMDVGLTDFPKLTLSETETRSILHGQKLRIRKPFSSNYCRLYSPGDRLVAIAIRVGNELHPKKVFVEGG